MKPPKLANILLITLMVLSTGSLAEEPEANLLRLEDKDENLSAKITDVAWITGQWRGEMFGGLAEEVWNPPFGDTMTGTYTLQKDGKAVFHEIMTIREIDSSLTLRLKHINPDMTSWEEKDDFVEFALVKIEKDVVYFDGLTLKKDGDNGLTIYMRMQQEGEEAHSMELKYKRIVTDGVDHSGRGGCDR